MPTLYARVHYSDSNIAANRIASKRACAALKEPVRGTDSHTCAPALDHDPHFAGLLCVELASALSLGR